MDSFEFICLGHENISATHKNTLEFTKDDELSLKGDCIVGVSAQYDKARLLEFLKNKDRLKIKIIANHDIFELNCDINKDFDDNDEMVFRRSNFLSERTLGINADKAAIDIPRKMVEKIKEKGCKVRLE